MDEKKWPYPDLQCTICDQPADRYDSRYHIAVAGCCDKHLLAAAERYALKMVRHDAALHIMKRSGDLVHRHAPGYAEKHAAPLKVGDKLH